jgi:ferrous iron transport protein B
MMWERASVFLKEAGTVILACTVALWVLLSFPRVEPEVPTTAAVTAVAAKAAPSPIAQSYGGRLGHAIEPVLAPLGFDWKIGVGLIGAFAAREVFVATLGLVYGIDDDGEDDASLRAQLRAERKADGSAAYTPLMGLSLLVFFAISCQCMSTLAAVKRETKSYKWPIFMFVYMTGLAYLLSFLVYQGGRLLGFG